MHLSVEVFKPAFENFLWELSLYNIHASTAVQKQLGYCSHKSYVHQSPLSHVTTKNLPHRLFCGQSLYIKSWTEVLLERNFTPKQGLEAAAKYVNVPQFPYSYGTFFMRLLAIYIFPESVQSSRIGKPILGIYKTRTETWVWKLGMRPHNSFSGNACFEFSVLYLSSVATLTANTGSSSNANNVNIQLFESPRVPSKLHATKQLCTVCRGHARIGSSSSSSSQTVNKQLFKIKQLYTVTKAAVQEPMRFQTVARG